MVSVADLKLLLTLPEVTVRLMANASINNPFYHGLVRDYYQETKKRHRKLPLFRCFRHGVALCPLPHEFDSYFMSVEGAARRNFKKATRLGYGFRKINYNEHLDDIKDIRASTDVRQGTLPEEFLSGPVEPCRNPDSLNDVHDYPYFGVLRDGKLYAYAGCFVCGEICMLEHIYGHADHQQDGVVPKLIMSIPEYLLDHHPNVRYYSYGMFFGAGESMRRFKKKLRFLPHRVNWILNS